FGKTPFIVDVLTFHVAAITHSLQEGHHKRLWQGFSRPRAQQPHAPEPFLFLSSGGPCADVSHEGREHSDSTATIQRSSPWAVDYTPPKRAYGSGLQCGRGRTAAKRGVGRVLGTYSFGQKRSFNNLVNAFEKIPRHGEAELHNRLSRRSCTCVGECPLRAEGPRA